MKMTIKEILEKTYAEYKLFPLDSGILLSLALAKPREYLLAHPEKKLSPAQIKKYFFFVRRRSAGEPIAYITGKKEFFGLELKVNKNVLIPRPETELLVERSIEKMLDIKNNVPDSIIDVGTGSGNIIISITKNIPKEIKKKINFYALDISKESLQVAKANAKKYKLDKKIKFIQSDLLKYFSENKTKLENTFIVANLPYVSAEIFKKNKNNLRHEPKQALISNDGGLKHYARLIGEIGKLNKKCYMLRATCFVEISPEQKPQISRFLKKYLPKAATSFHRDLSGKWRVAEVKI
jgi:release factor glutamine methyltransferase